ncbi:protein-tyrosine phosphatase-like protein [Jimgerdemannia flammicorona]|uniref:Protein-tyrosine phosphatase-like protein n=1 Tax=Jimgerdemannia flammicorona TaxID=994334 RepID=A0A433QYZ5_9FUNG|nr:protein-tyrosine phosphatase-like protein [Jimgerdemannia flammicorona]
MSSVDSMPPVYPTQAHSSDGHAVVIPKNSLTHPINISWMIPDEHIPYLTATRLPENIDLFDLLTNPAAYELEAGRIADALASADTTKRMGGFIGNLALSSCPGKKVRLNGPVRGRASINRDLDLDFQRLRSFGITTVVCCLNDSELAFLGAPWPKYYELATKNNIDIIRLPMIEGSCPENVEGIDAIVDEVSERMKTGQNVLAHCRGGVGRAGLFACCWFLKNLYCLSPERAIRLVRMRRSPKAIETMRQAEFIVHYAEHVGRALERQSMAEVRAHMMLERERQRERELVAQMHAQVARRERRAEVMGTPVEIVGNKVAGSQPPKRNSL